MDRDLGKSHSSLTGEIGYRSLLPEGIIRPSGAGAVDISMYPGFLIALEGTDGVGRSTQTALLREWLETLGYGVLHTTLIRSRLAGEGLRKAKSGTTLGQRTMDLFYATDFADRLENDIVPALRAGFVVLSDRYVFSLIARSIVRGGDRSWLRSLYRFAPVPHAIFYLKVDIPHLVPRVLARGGFDYWESGMDHRSEGDLYSSFVPYQNQLLEVFDQLSKMYPFQILDANRGIVPLFHDLKEGILRILSTPQGAAS